MKNFVGALNDCQPWLPMGLGCTSTILPVAGIVMEDVAESAERIVFMEHTQFLLKQSCEQKKLSLIPCFRQVGH